MATTTPWSRHTPEISAANVNNPPALYDYPHDYYNTSAPNSHQQSSADQYLHVDQAYLPASSPPLQQRMGQLQGSPKPHSTSISGIDLQSGANSNRISFMIEADGRRSGMATHSSSGSGNVGSSHHSRIINPGRSDSKQQETMLEHWLVPDDRIRFWALWTSLFTVAACFVFAFMAGQYSLYQLSPLYRQYHSSSNTNSSSSSSMIPLTDTWGPGSLQGWLKFWVSSPQYSFDVPYLMAWGARYLTAIRDGEWWRLFSSICIHGNFAHLLSNIITFVILAVPLEHSYGPLRIFIIFLAAGFGGTFLSMAFEDACMVYVGASGAVFGFLGLYLADIVLNWESIYRPLLRLALMLVSLGLTLGIEFATARTSALQKVSHMSHVGGLVLGLFVSFMFLPNLRDRRWKAARKFANRLSERWSHAGGAAASSYVSAGAPPPSAAVNRASVMHRMQSCWRRHAWLYWMVWVLSAGVVLFFFVGLPVYIWTYKMPGLTCPPVMIQA